MLVLFRDRLAGRPLFLKAARLSAEHAASVMRNGETDTERGALDPQPAYGDSGNVVG